MTKRNYILLLFAFLLVTAMLNSYKLYAQNLTKYVNPFIGTSGGGNTHPGALVPNGMVSVCPFNVYGEPNDKNMQNNVLAAQYKNNNRFITGFSHVNLSGTGCPDLGAMLIMPIKGDLKTDPQEYGSFYENEKAEPGYYETRLTKYDILAQMTATERVGVSRYHLPAGESHILLNLDLALTMKNGGFLRINSPHEVVGMRNTGEFCRRKFINQPVYFVMQLSNSADDFGAWAEGHILPQYRRDLPGREIGAFFTFQEEQEHIVTVRIGVSYVSIENARINLQREVGNTDFDSIRKQADRKWENRLSRISVEGGTEEDKILFYTGLYHILIHPYVFNDVNGEYPVMDGHEIRSAKGYTRYSVFSLWDTYRNVHPFLSLVYPDLQRNMAVSMVEMYKEAGRLPKWELNSRETYVMVGDPACIVLNDTYQRGIRDFDVQTAYKAMVESATDTTDNAIRPFNAPYRKYGFIPAEMRRVGVVSIQQEYALADWNVAQMAKSMDDKENYQMIFDQSMSYKNVFNKETGFLRPRYKDGSWLEPFDPLGTGRDKSKIHGYVEGNAWQYLFFVPHDTEGLIELLGKKKFISKLEEALNEEDKFTLHNEPDMAYPFLFNYVKGEEWRTSKYVQASIQDNFKNSPDGLPGNDDCGTMSAWLVFSMMGIYPDCPGDPNFTLFQPAFDKITIHLDLNYYNGEKLIIQKTGKEQQLIYNGKKLKSPFISHLELVKGGELKIGK